MANFSKFRARGAKIRLNTNTKEGTINFLKMMSEVDGGKGGGGEDGGKGGRGVNG
jgi:hypothetical protein